MNKIIDFWNWFIYEPACPRKLIKIDNNTKKEIMEEVLHELKYERTYYYLCYILRMHAHDNRYFHGLMLKLDIQLIIKGATLTKRDCRRPWAFDPRASRIKWVEESLKQYYSTTGETNESK